MTNWVQKCNLFLATCAAGIGGTFQYGYNISVINAPTEYIQRFINETWEDRYQTTLNPHLLTFLWSITVSIFTLGGLIGSQIGGILAIRFGRKGALLINNSSSLLAALLMGISYSAGTFELIIIGRFLIGINSGVSVCVQPLYVNEIAPKAVRGLMSMSSSIFITGGILTGQVIGLRELLGREEYVPLLLSSCCIPAIIQLISLPWLPESPRHLLIDKNNELKCQDALKAFHGSNDYHSEMEDIQKENIALGGEKLKKPWDLYSDPTTRPQLLTVIGLNAGQQFSGINAIYFYATYIFTQAGITANKIPYATVGTGACECLTALTCGFFIERLGRRVLLLGGYSLMAFWCIMLTISLTYQEVYEWVPYLSMVCIFAFILSFGLGPARSIPECHLFFPLPSASTKLFFVGLHPVEKPGKLLNGRLLLCEIKPDVNVLLNARQKKKVFIKEGRKEGGLKQYCFLVFLVECSLVVTLIFFMVPETKNKSFLEIRQLFLNRDIWKMKKTREEIQNGGPLLNTEI
ncbi:solute carrier family 2, facilitated glucose transporter member 11-like [Protopterus annectens]|uniref:solute carrier family 2, facilitated glucose transporter member 11-like n=1 Tax=Protopterus annectens TaxID=7888 RepID=UPI001CF96C64|nr:solute carrier family 2, facilitated glucose transporter member 11-like [Protopterus annectens]